MENASKALLMAGGVLIGILILALMVTLFASAKSLSNGYETTKQSETIQQFNVNFTKYVGKDLTIHQVVTICNFALENGFSKASIQGIKDKDDIKNNNKKYILIINGYSEEGYISSISFTEKN